MIEAIKSMIKAMTITMNRMIQTEMTIPNMTGHQRMIAIDNSKKTRARMHRNFVMVYNQTQTFSTSLNILVYYLGKDGMNETLELIAFDVFEKKKIEKEEDEMDEMDEFEEEEIEEDEV